MQRFVFRSQWAPCRSLNKNCFRFPLKPTTTNNYVIASKSQPYGAMRFFSVVISQRQQQQQQQESITQESSNNNHTDNESTQNQGNPPISINDFIAVNMLIGTIKHVDTVPKSKKLFKLLVDMGNNETRQILSGVRQFYPTEESVSKYLLNKQCIVVENLEKRRMMGLESHGMILFTTGVDKDGNDAISLVSPCNSENQSDSPCIVANGTRVL